MSLFLGTPFLSPRLQLVGLAILLTLMAGCGEDDPAPDPGTGGENAVTNNLSILRQDETPLVMGTDYAICCGTWQNGDLDQNTLKIFIYDPRFMSEPDSADSFWKLFLVIDEVAVGSPYSFPTEFGSPVRLFLGDVVTGNELSGDADDSMGAITINSMDCGPPVRVSLTIDATIGSEFHLAPTVHISGTFSATIHENLSPLGCDFGI